MNIYLDHNAFVDVMRERRLPFPLDLKRRLAAGDRLIYSPAHIEEIANIYRSEISAERAKQYVQEHLSALSTHTDNWELLPCDGPNSGPARLVRENPEVCMRRVIKHYDLTHFAERNEEALRSRSIVRGGKITPLDAFKDKQVLGLFQHRMIANGFEFGFPPLGDSLQENHTLTTMVIDAAFRSLCDAGYDFERRSKTRSSIHDVTHAVYGSYADIFVSSDPKLLRKSGAVYNFLKFKCRVMSAVEKVSVPNIVFIIRIQDPEGTIGALKTETSQLGKPGGRQLAAFILGQDQPPLLLGRSHPPFVVQGH